MTLSRVQSRVVTGILTGRKNLRKYLPLLGLSNSPFLGGVRPESKPQLTSCVNARLRPHADMCPRAFGARGY